jgi:3-deoxy-manno-octulosonate cytidylyltransferase (CMP-KDO synthetase)
MTSAIIIPARMASTRFPGKPLCDLGGKPMIQWVYEAAKNANVSSRILIATPDWEIIQAAEAFGAEAVATRDDHPSGTDRLAEVAESIIADFYVNVQGDEPLIDPSTIRACAEPLRDPLIDMTSVWAPCEEEEHSNPAVVKVVTNLAGDALYFSRHPIPFPRNGRVEPVKKHIGIYGYRRQILLNFSRWAPTPLELSESLEQLRFLENGITIRMVEGRASGIGVDTPDQAEQVRKLLDTAKNAKGT